MVTVAFVAVVLALQVGPGLPGGGGGPVASDLPQAQSVLDPPEPRAADAHAATPAFAAFGPLTLHLPATDPVVVGFHEASAGEALELAPIGQAESNDNTTKFEPPPEASGADYRVMASRGRANPATSAVDVVMREDEPVLAPVAGTVTEVEEYVLYGGHRDVRIEIAPADEPDLRVVLIHVADVEVEAGDGVRSGETVLAATARPFPFGSQVDRFTEPDRWPHVHMEVKHEDGEG